MKRLSLGILVLLLFLLTFQQKVLAQSTSSAILDIQYDLPYTGILPDNPLYFLKALRDNVVAIFITDPLKKADYNLLMSDKRLGGAEALFNKGKNDLAITTLGKSGNYFHQAIQKIADAKKQGEDADAAISKLVNASQKHQQVISQMIQKSKGETKKNLKGLLNRMKEFQSSVEQLIPSK